MNVTVMTLLTQKSKRGQMELLGITETVSRVFCTSTQCAINVVGLLDEYIKSCMKNTTTMNIIRTLTAISYVGFEVFTAPTEYCLPGCDTVSFGTAA